MRTWQMAAAAALIAAGGVVAVVPAPAMAAGTVNCDLGGHTANPRIDYVYCTLFDIAPSGELWQGIEILAGQGTANLTAGCVVGSETYYPHVSYTNNGVPATAGTVLNCDSGGKV
jgi:hypothetical protein